MSETQLGLRENPFLTGHHPSFVYPSRSHQEALAHLRHGIRNRVPLVVVTGELGTGKTLAVYDALGEWGPRAVVALISGTALTHGELFQEICQRFGVDAPQPVRTEDDLARTLGAVRARGDLALLLVDDAHALAPALLDEVGRLSELEMAGQSLLGVILVGEPALMDALDQPELSQVRERVAIHCQIEPLSADETQEYIHHRVAAAGGDAAAIFPPDTCMEIYRLTGGVPSEINALASDALSVAGQGNSTVVTPDLLVPPEGPATPRRSAGVPVERPVTRAEIGGEPEPQPFATEIPPPSGSAPEPREESLPAPRRASRTPIRKAPEPTPVQGLAPDAPTPGDVDAPDKLLPSWFDDIVARRQIIDAQPPVEIPSPADIAEPAPVDESAQFEGDEPDFADDVAAVLDDPEIEESADMASVAAEVAPPTLESPRGMPGEIPNFLAPRSTPAPIPEAPSDPMQDALAKVLDRIATPHPQEHDAPVEPAWTPAMPAEPRESAESAAPASDDHLPIERTPAEVAAVPMPPAPPVDFVPDARESAMDRVASYAHKWLVPIGLLVATALALFLLWNLTAKRAAPPPPRPQTKHRAAVRRSTSPPLVVAPPTAAHVAAPVAPAPTKQPPPSSTKVSTLVTPSGLSTTHVTVPVAPRPAKQPPQSPVSASTVKPAPSPVTKTTTAAPSKPPATPTVAKPAASGRHLFGVTVGTYLFEDRALAKKASLSEASGLPARVITVVDGGTSVYRVVLGSFESRAAAQRAADDMIGRGVANEARVTPLEGTTAPSQ